MPDIVEIEKQTNSIEVVTATNQVEVYEQSAKVIELVEKGVRGERGADAENGAAQNVFIQDTQPTATGSYLWVDTSGGNISFWVNT